MFKNVHQTRHNYGRITQAILIWIEDQDKDKNKDQEKDKKNDQDKDKNKDQDKDKNKDQDELYKP